MPEPDAPPLSQGDTVQPGVMEVALLYDLTRFREALARSIARNNLELRSDQITEAVNRILFPLLLLRVAEDRHLVPSGILENLRNCPDVRGLISDLAGYADAFYADESPLTTHTPDPGDNLKIETKVILAVLDSLTSPARRYNLQEMSTLAVSAVLMQYLTRTIRRSATQQATVVDTHDTVVSGGSVIPPLPLVGYLVRRALAITWKNRSAREILPLRVYDPACGSGTILLAVFRQLLEDNGGPALTLDERREILTNSVHGIDISRHAVAATRMLLFLELCSSHMIMSQGDFSTLVRSVLRDLRHTVLCGNALVGPEIVHDESWMFCPARDRHLLNPFSYRDRFPEIFAGGGFDAVVCNPPEGALEQREWIQQYFQRHYRVYHPSIDRSAYIVEKSLSLLTPGGTVSCIMSSRWLRGAAGSSLRDVIGARQIEEIVDLSPVPAGKPGAGLCLIRVRVYPPTHDLMAVIGDTLFIEDPDLFVPGHTFPVDQRQFNSGGWVLRDTRGDEILRKVIRHSTTLENFVMGQVHTGIDTKTEGPHIIDGTQVQEWLKRTPQSKPLLRRVITGPEIQRYSAGEPGMYLILIPEGWTSTQAPAGKKPWQWLRHRHPLIARHLQSHKELLKARAGPDGLWWETRCDEIWREPRKKILFPSPFRHLAFWFDPGRGIGDETTGAISSAGMYAVGILNSRLMAFVFDHGIRASSSDRKNFTWEDLRNLPLYTPDLDRHEDLACHDRMEQLVRRMIDLEKNIRATQDDSERDALQKKIRKTDKAINALVYALYGLTPEEINVVERSSPM